MLFSNQLRTNDSLWSSAQEQSLASQFCLVLLVVCTNVCNTDSHKSWPEKIRTGMFWYLHPRARVIAAGQCQPAGMPVYRAAALDQCHVFRLLRRTVGCVQLSPPGHLITLSITTTTDLCILRATFQLAMPRNLFRPIFPKPPLT